MPGRDGLPGARDGRRLGEGRRAQPRGAALLRAGTRAAAALRPEVGAAFFHHVLRGGGRLRRPALHLRGHAAAGGLLPRRPVPGAWLPARARNAAGPAVPGRRQVHRPGRDRGAAGRTAVRHLSRRPRLRARMEPRIPAGGARRPRHDAARPDRRRSDLGARGSRAPSGVRPSRSRPARHSSSPTWLPRRW